jgi:GNAT superfamily N-acetyltransferase
MSAQNITIRNATQIDAEGVASLINAAFVVERLAFEGDRIDTPGVAALLGKGTFLVAEFSGKPAGCVYLEIQGERSYLGLLSVAPTHQGAGIGRKLVAAAEDYSRKAQCQTMDLRIISPRAESLLPFYQHLGYMRMGTAPFSTAASSKKPKVPCHYILMSKALS